MDMKEYFNYDNPKFLPLRQPARDVVDAYQRANRFLDTVKESLYIEHGLIHTSEMVHKLAHEMPKQFDAFGDMLHERHLMVEYPATPELTERIESVDKGFEIVITVLDEVQEALEKFHAVTDTADFRPMALKTEELMLQNSQDYTRFLEAWMMYGKRSSDTSFDNWVLHLLEEEGEADE